MRIGRLGKRVVIEEVTLVDDGQGGWTEAWASRGEVFAGVEPLRGQERFEAQKINAKVSHKVVIRYQAGLTPAMRVNYQGRYLTIDGVVNINEKNQTLELYCSEEA